LESQNRGNQGQSDQNQNQNRSQPRRRRRRGPGGGHRPAHSTDGQSREAGENVNQNSQNPRTPNAQHQRSDSGNGTRAGGSRNQRPGGGQNGRYSAENRNRSQSGPRTRSRSGRVLTINQVLVKYDNLLDQHLITRKKYYEYFNRVDDRQLMKLEKNFFDSIEHLRRFEANLEPWQREALEKRKTERYRPDLTYSSNRGWIPEEIAKVEVTPEEITDPHFTENQKEAFEAWREDTEESAGNYEDYLKYKGLT
jgi:hypothetical protein